MGAYPKCSCPGFVAPNAAPGVTDATPGVTTWDELLDHMDDLVEWSGETIEGWHSRLWHSVIALRPLCVKKHVLWPVVIVC